MKKAFLASALLAALIAVVWLAATADRRAIFKSLARLERLVSKNEAETPLEALTRAKDIAARFTRAPEVHLPPYVTAVADRQELAALIHQGRAMADTIQVHVYDKSLQFAADRRAATLHLTARGTATRAGNEDSDVRELELEWVREEGAWRVRRVRTVSAIRHPAAEL